MTNTDRRGRFRRALGVARICLEVAVVVAVIWLFVFQVSLVSGHSMDPNLAVGDRLVVNRYGHWVTGVERFDVIVFRCSGSDGTDFVKRVVGLPGETVQLRRGELLIDGVSVEQVFLHETEPFASYPEVMLGEDEYFVLGDNRPLSRDSRNFGPVRRSDIKGVVRFRLYPLNRISVF